MDGNSTIAFFTAYGGGLLGIAQVIAAAVLAYFTIQLYKATDRYANLADLQNAIMKEQNEKVESQNRIMKSQNQLMRENKDKEILIMKYNRMLDEMKYLVAPLYARRNDQQIFALREFGSKIRYTTVVGDIRMDPILIEFFEFWENIFRYSYLNQSNYLDINKYQHSIKNILRSKEKRDEKDRKFRYPREEFINMIECRYIELAAQISETEKELNASV